MSVVRYAKSGVRGPRSAKPKLQLAGTSSSLRERTTRDHLRQGMAISLASVASAILFVILGMWVEYGGLTSVHTTADVLTSLGRLSGLLAAYSLLLQVLLMSRLPFVEFAYGWPWTSAWHKLNGKICLGLVAVHVVLVIVGYAMTAHLTVMAEAVQMLEKLDGMPAAYISTAAMIAIVGTSIFIVRKRLRYELWYAVHLLTYAAVLLAWFHQIPTSTIFVNNPIAVALWTALYVGTLQFFVLFRFLQPTFRTVWHGLRVSDVVVEDEGVVTVKMTGRHLEYFNARAGQFFIWRFLAPGFWHEAHPFSLSAAPDGSSFRITVKGVGDFTSRLPRLKPGTRVVPEGPFGSFTAEARRHKRSAMIAGGIGITPIRALLEQIEGKPTLIYRAIREEEFHLRKELDAIAERTGITIHYIAGDHRDPKNARLLSAGHLKSLIPDIASRDVYLCGPIPMMQTVETTVRGLGVPRRHIHKDTFTL